MNDIKSMIEKVMAKLNKLSPTCTGVHVDRPMGSDNDARIKKLKTDYDKAVLRLKAMRETNNVNVANINDNDNNIQEDKAVDTSEQCSEIYRGKSF